MAYRLPSGWSKDLDGPPPSSSGYYVLTALTGEGALPGTILIAAHDRFFATAPAASPAELVSHLHHQISEIDGITIDPDPLEMTIAGRRFARLDFGGVGLFRTTLVTESRCHFVSFNFTTNDPAVLSDLVLSLNALSLGPPPGISDSILPCVKDYATPERVRVRVEPTPAAPKFTVVPVRVIIGPDGRARHIHVIRGSAEQRTSIIEALTQWRFKPPVIDGRATEVETGLTFRF
jgi:TonB-like protein